ncbi:MAG: hypothetical protein ACRDPF_37605 [Streptosporangiaceae bacterium]
MERYVGLLAEVPSVFAPGATYSYCNSGYVPADPSSIPMDPPGRAGRWLAAAGTPGH